VYIPYLLTDEPATFRSFISIRLWTLIDGPDASGACGIASVRWTLFQRGIWTEMLWRAAEIAVIHNKRSSAYNLQIYKKLKIFH